TNAIHFYIRPQSGGEAQVTRAGTTDTYMPMRAAEFITASSEIYKDNIEEWEVDALSLIRSNKQFKWNPKSNPEITNYGDVVEFEGTPEVIKMGDGISGASKAALLWVGMQQLIERVEALEKEEV